MGREFKIKSLLLLLAPAGLCAVVMALSMTSAEAAIVWPSPLFDWMGESGQGSARYGYSLAGAGDVNNDGYNDIIIGALDWDTLDLDEGRAFVYFGSSAGLNENPDWTYGSPYYNGRISTNVTGGVDVNGDGYDDIFIGAPHVSSTGRVLGFYGSASGPAVDPSWDRIGEQTNEGFGMCLAGAGDVNGDGYGDVIVSSISYGSHGRIALFNGSSGGLSFSPSWFFQDYPISEAFGSRCAGAGDLNGDGYDDIIVSAYSWSNPEEDEGAVFIFYGSAAGPSDEPDWFMESDIADAYFGWKVSPAGDVNGDGYDDVLATLRENDVTSSRVYLFSGSASGLSAGPTWIMERDSYYFGYGVGHADVNDDGYDDLIIGDGSITSPEYYEGAVSIFYGSSSGPSSAPDWEAESNQVSADMGQAVAGIGDVNGDGTQDVLFGAPYYDHGQADEGAAFAYYSPLPTSGTTTTTVATTTTTTVATTTTSTTTTSGTSTTTVTTGSTTTTASSDDDTDDDSGDDVSDDSADDTQTDDTAHDDTSDDTQADDTASDDASDDTSDDTTGDDLHGDDDLYAHHDSDSRVGIHCGC